MTFTRIPILGSTGLLLMMMACSAKEPARTSNSSAPQERLDSNGDGSDSDPNQADRSKPISAETPSPCAEPFTLDNLKWLNTLEKPRVFVPSKGKDEQGNVRDEYTVTASQTSVQMLPNGCPSTALYAYGGVTRKDDGTDERTTSDSPGVTFEMTRGAPARVEWINGITMPHLLDPTLLQVPIITHVHGLEVGSDSDGSPGAAFTATAAKPNTYSDYPNSQPATTLWYHDHALGITRLNVYAGLAGMYIIRDPASDVEKLSGLPDRAHEMPLVIQDKAFDHSTGSLVYPPPETTFVVNGKVWPDMKVDRTVYRFRMLNADNSQTFTFSLKAAANAAQAPADATPKTFSFKVIGSDGGYLAAPLAAESVRLAPGERADVLIDFSALDADQSIFLGSDAGDVVRFTTNARSVTLPQLPEALDTKIVQLKPDVAKRTVTLLNAPNGYLLNGLPYDAPVSEKPLIGSTEDWDIVNISYEDHPIHLHLVQFEVVQRRQLKPEYSDAWTSANAGVTLPLDKPLSAAPSNPDADGFVLSDSEMDDNAKKTAQILATEGGWKDTVVAPAGFVTTIRVRWAPQQAPASTTKGSNAFLPLDPTLGPGYVWHCHMLEHEDNDMMRPFKLVNE